MQVYVASNRHNAVVRLTAARIDRPLYNRRAWGMHEASALLLRAADSSGMGSVDVSTPRSSSAAVSGLVPGSGQSSLGFSLPSRLCPGWMPPRTTRKSYRPRVSDRTMVGTLQPPCLSVSDTEWRRDCGKMKNLWDGKTNRLVLFTRRVQSLGFQARKTPSFITWAGNQK